MKFFLFSFIFLHLPLFSQDINELKKTVDFLVYSKLDIDFERSPNFIVGVIEKDTFSIFSYSAKMAEKTDAIVPSVFDLFEIGSLTNLITASLINDFVQEGRINLDSSINRFLPDTLFNPSAYAISINSLLTHTSGLPRLPLGIGFLEKEDNQPFAHYTKGMIEQEYKSFNFKEKTTNDYSFSHLGYALLEIIIEHSTQSSFENILRKKLEEWKMFDTFITLNSISKKKLIQGYDKAYNKVTPRKYSSFEGAVGLKSNMNDLLRFLQLNIDTNKYDSLHKIQAPTGIRKNTSVGQGWHIIEPKKYYPIVLHTGATSGYRGYMAFVKETKTGVVVLSNSEYALKGLGYFILKEINNNFKK